MTYVRAAHATSVMRQYFVYILSSRSRQLYVGVTNSLSHRLAQHRDAKVSYTARYRIHRLVYCEIVDNPYDAIRREKQIKTLTRAKKIELICSMNPAWNELGKLFGLVDHGD